MWRYDKIKLLTSPMLWNPLRFAISWASWLSMLRLNLTKNELVNNSPEDDGLDDVTLVNKRASSPKRRENHCFGIFLWFYFLSYFSFLCSFFDASAHNFPAHQFCTQLSTVSKKNPPLWWWNFSLFFLSRCWNVKTI